MLEQKYISGTTAVKIARSIEAAAASGKVAAGETLPSLRALAAHLGVALATVAAAYRILQHRGITIGDGRRGTKIRPAAAAPSVAATALALPRGIRDLAEGNPDRALLPDLGRAVRKLKSKQRLYGEEFEKRPLVKAARRQFRKDGVPAKSVAIVSGALDGIERVLRERLRAGDRVIVEDPGFTGILDLLASLNLTAIPAAVDDEGILPDALQRAVRNSMAQAIIITPRAQNPTGAAISRRRASRLRAILRKRPDLLVIEDDHAGPVAGAPYVTLVDRGRERWAVVRSVSKFLGPDLRVAMLAADEETVAAIERRQMIGIRWVSNILQDVVVALLTDRRLSVAEKTYAARRNALMRALAKRGIESHGRSGLNVWVPVSEETAVVQALYQRGWAVKPGEHYRLESGPAIRVTIATLTEAAKFANDLAEVIASPGRAAA